MFQTLCFCHLNFGHSDLFRASYFGFRILNLIHLSITSYSTSNIQTSLIKEPVQYPHSSSYIVPERKVMFRPNPNIEIRAKLPAGINTKKLEYQMTKWPKLRPWKYECFIHWNILISVIVSFFLLRISNF